MTYFLHLAISFRYSSATTTQYQKFRSVYSLHLGVPNNHTITKWHPFKISKIIDKSSAIWKVVLTIPRCHHDCLFKATNVTKFFLCTAHTHFSSIPIGCHVPLTDFSACSLVLEFSDSLYIHHDYLLFHILHLLISHASWRQKITRYTNSTLLDFVVNNLIA